MFFVEYILNNAFLWLIVWYCENMKLKLHFFRGSN